jgi:hypothetical protein
MDATTLCNPLLSEKLRSIGQRTIGDGPTPIVGQCGSEDNRRPLRRKQCGSFNRESELLDFGAPSIGKTAVLAHYGEAAFLERPKRNDVVFRDARVERPHTE